MCNTRVCVNVDAGVRIFTPAQTIKIHSSYKAGRGAGTEAPFHPSPMRRGRKYYANTRHWN